MKEISNIIEGILFLSGNSVEINDIINQFPYYENEIDDAIAELKEKYQSCGISLLQFDGKLQFSTNSKYAEDVAKVLNPIREREFSQSMLEVASIVAYKQPVTRLEIEQIRGVSSEYAITALLKQKIIKTAGRKDAVGKPFLFATTENFLKKFNLEHISDLPNYDELMKKLEFMKEREEQLFIDAENLPQAEETDPLEIPDFLDGEDVEKIG